MSKQKLPASRHRREKVGSTRRVKSIIDRFILKDATIHDLLTALRAASKKGSARAPTVTTSAFVRIIRQAIQKRQRQLRTRG